MFWNNRNLFSQFWRPYVRRTTLRAQSCPTFCNPMGRRPPGSSVHRILQARILEWSAISSFRESSCSRDRMLISYVSWIAGGIFTTSTTLEAPGMSRQTIPCFFQLLMTWEPVFENWRGRMFSPWDLYIDSRIPEWQLLSGQALFPQVLQKDLNNSVQCKVPPLPQAEKAVWAYYLNQN